MTKAPEKPPRKGGPAHFLAAAQYSMAGARRLIREAAFRQELAGGAVVLGVLLWSDASLIEIVGFLILFLILLAFEALNTAVEELVDHLSPDWSEFAKHAKDMGSFAVMCLLVANGIYAGCVLFL